MLKLIVRLLWWNSLPNGHKAQFFNIWAGQRRRDKFRVQLREDFAQVLTLLQRGDLTAQVAARVPLTLAAEAVRLAESGTVTGKVVLVPARN